MRRNVIKLVLCTAIKRLLLCELNFICKKTGIINYIILGFSLQTLVTFDADTHRHKTTEEDN